MSKIRLLILFMLGVWLTDVAECKIACIEAINQDAQMVLSIDSPSALQQRYKAHTANEPLLKSFYTLIATQTNTQEQAVEGICTLIASLLKASNAHDDISELAICFFRKNDKRSDVLVLLRTKDTERLYALEDTFFESIGKIAKTNNVQELSIAHPPVPKDIQKLIPPDKHVERTIVSLGEKIVVAALQYGDIFVYSQDVALLDSALETLVHPEIGLDKQTWAQSISKVLSNYGPIEIYYSKCFDSLLLDRYSYWGHSVSVADDNSISIRTVGLGVKTNKERQLLKQLGPPEKSDLGKFQTSDTLMQVCVSGLGFNDLRELLAHEVGNTQKFQSIDKFIDELCTNNSGIKRDDLDAALGNKFSLVCRFDKTTSVTQYAAAAVLGDPNAFRTVNVGIRRLVEKALARYSIIEMLGQPLRIRYQDIEGGTLSFMPVLKKEPKVVPSYFSVDDYCLISTSPDYLTAIVQASNIPSKDMAIDTTGHFYFHVVTSLVDHWTGTSIECRFLRNLSQVYSTLDIVASCQDEATIIYTFLK